LRQHALSSAVTIVSIALAGGLLISVWVVREQSQEAFTGVNAGFDAVLGARGSKLQLVLNAVFHLDESPGNLAWSDYLEIAGDPNVALAVPLAMGDNYRGYRVVGVTPELFTEVEYAAGRRYRILPPGRVFEPTLREAVVGSFAAARLGLRLGDRFQPYHGLRFDERHVHAERYVVVGVLEPSNTPADRVIWIPLKGVQLMSGHDPAAAGEVSAVLVRLKSAIAGRAMEVRFNRDGDRLTFAWPIAQIMARFFERIVWFERVLAWVSYLVAAVAAGTVLAGIHNSMNERRHDIAILRALGAHRRTVFGAIVLEAVSLAAVGMLAGFLVYGGLTMGVAQAIRAQTGVVLDPWSWSPVMFWAPLAMMAVSAVAGVVPATKAYRTDVATHLAPFS
jgi:putative ABC transport system permease protein